jgi:hypothetical protein
VQVAAKYPVAEGNVWSVCTYKILYKMLDRIFHIMYYIIIGGDLYDIIIVYQYGNCCWYFGLLCLQIAGQAACKRNLMKGELRYDFT